MPTSFLSRLRDTAASLIRSNFAASSSLHSTVESKPCQGEACTNPGSSFPTLLASEARGLREVHRLSDRVSLAMMTAAEAASSGIDFTTTPCRVFNVCTPSRASMSDPYLVPTSLDDLDWFGSFMSCASSEGSEHHIILCTGTDRQTITKCCLLVGSFMIIHEDCVADGVAAAFSPVAHLFLPFTTECSRSDPFRVEDCWRALHRSKTLGWVATTCQDHFSLHMDHVQHDLGVSVLVPSKLIIIDCPATLQDDAETEHTLSRNHDPSYYAEILADLDVDLVVRCCEDNVYDEGVFVEWGVAVEDINVNDHRFDRLLQRVDRFLTLARVVPGAIAIHGDRNGLSHAQILISVLLIRYYGFDALSAMAWTCMVHPHSGDVSESRSLHLVEPPRPILKLRVLSCDK